jgi:aspartyl-tRNA synthetase
MELLNLFLMKVALIKTFFELKHLVEFVIQVKELLLNVRPKNKNIPTGDIEILVTELNILASLTPFYN